MARTALPITNAVANSGTVNPSTTNVDQANGMVITMPTTDVPADANSDRLLLVVTNTAVSSKHILVRAGANNPPAFRKDLGDISVAVAASGTGYIGPFEWARITQGGTINVDFDSGFTGTILALLLPHTV